MQKLCFAIHFPHTSFIFKVEPTKGQNFTLLPVLETKCGLLSSRLYITTISRSYNLTLIRLFDELNPQIIILLEDIVLKECLTLHFRE